MLTPPNQLHTKATLLHSMQLLKLWDNPHTSSINFETCFWVVQLTSMYIYAAYKHIDVTYSTNLFTHSTSCQIIYSTYSVLPMMNLKHGLMIVHHLIFIPYHYSVSGNCSPPLLLLQLLLQYLTCLLHLSKWTEEDKSWR